MNAPSPENGMTASAFPGTSSLTAATPQEVSRTYRRSAVWIFFIFLGVHLFIFRGMLIHLPDIFAGRAVLNTSELVPFFDPYSQFFEQAGGAFSDLTNAYEFRVRYSLLTTWMRFHLFLPFTIVFAPFLGAFLMTIVISEFLRRLLTSIPASRILHATALTTLFLHLILLPAKITHFYTLILGFDIYVVSFVLFLLGFLLETRRPVILLLASSLVALVNPTVHFQVIYPLTVVFFCAGTCILLLISGGKRTNPDVPGQEAARIPLRLWKRIILAMIFILFVTALPYGLFVKFYVLRDVTNLTDVVPDTVASIRSSSLSLLHQISFDMSSVTENYLTGEYIAKTPHFTKVFYFLIALIPFILPVSTDPREKRRLRPFLILVGILMLFGMWCSIGYAPIVVVPTFHMILAAAYRQLYLLPGDGPQFIMRLITEVVHVLRYPDRFQFIFFMATSLLMPLGLLILDRECCSRIRPHLRLGRMAGTALSACLFFLPLFAQWQYRTALLTGDFGGFVHPYDVRPLLQIREALDPLPQGKVVVLPPSEGPWIGEGSDGNPYKFIDKFFIYYLNRPSYYFGLTGDAESKYWFFLLFQSLSQNEHWWVNIFRNLDIRYLVLNKELTHPVQSAWYLQKISQAITQQPAAMPQFFRKVIENDRFALYEFIDPPMSSATDLFVDTNWDAFRCLQERDFLVSRDRRIQSINTLHLAPGNTLDVLAEDRRKAVLDLFAKENAGFFARPDQSSFAFMEEHIPSSQYFGTVFPMLNALTVGTYNIFQIMMPGPFDTLTTAFVSIRKPTTLRFPLTVQKNGTYELLLRSVPTRHSFSLRIDDGPVTSLTVRQDVSRTRFITPDSASFSRQSPAVLIDATPDHLFSSLSTNVVPASEEFTYLSLGTQDLQEGKQTLFLQKLDGNPIAIDGVLLVPVQKQAGDIPLSTTLRFHSPSAFPQ